MNSYKGYLNGVNPNFTRKVLQDDDPRYFTMDSGRFVNGKDEELKTMAEAIKVNDQIDEEYKKAWPPQKAIGAKPVRVAAKPGKIYSGAPGDLTPGPYRDLVNRNKKEEKLFENLPIFSKNISKKITKQSPIESDASVNRRTWKKVEDNRANGKADYEGFQTHEIIVANSYADTKKLQKEITDNLNEYIKSKLPKIVQKQQPTPTPSFISNPQPKSKGIADEGLLADLKIRREVLDGK